jgi:hypothetical protein
MEGLTMSIRLKLAAAALAVAGVVGGAAAAAGVFTHAPGHASRPIAATAIEYG